MRRLSLSLCLALLATACQPDGDAPVLPTEVLDAASASQEAAEPGTVESLDGFNVASQTVDGTDFSFRRTDSKTQTVTTTASAEEGGINPVVTESGFISLSVDGLGVYPGNSGTLQVEKPAGATVRGAYLASATTWTCCSAIPDGGIVLNGQPVSWQIVVNPVAPWSHWADVTSLVKTTIDGAPAGIVNISLSEPVGSYNVDGSILAVIFDDPNQTTDNTVSILFGGQQLAGDNFFIGLSDPVDTSDPDLIMEMSLGISYGAQPGGQVSLVDVNGARLTSSAGGQDDGQLSNGALITVGGVGDSPANPSPYAGASSTRTDDELYDLVPFVDDGDQIIEVHTSNPSYNDNVFFAAFFLSVAGQVVTEDPVANAGPDQEVEIDGPLPFAEVTIDGSGSFDPDGSIVSYQWFIDGDPFPIPAPTFNFLFEVGVYTVTLIVTDDDGLTDEDEAIITVLPPADASPPVITYELSGPVGDNDWYTGPVSVTWTVEDLESEIISSTCDPDTAPDDGEGQTFTCSATSLGGTTVATTEAFKIDQTAPEVTVELVGTEGDNDWFISDVTVDFTATDGGSGIAVDCTDVTVSADGTGYQESCTATDNAGNSASATSAEFMIDQTAPTATATISGDEGNNGWYVGPVTVSWATDDNLSGVASGCADEDFPDDGAGQSASCTVTDNAGNSADADSDPFDIDQTDPELSYSSYDGIYDVADYVDITCSASDATSDIASAVCDNISGDAWSFGLGTHTFSASAEDNAGNTSTDETSFTVSASYDGLCSLVEQWVSHKGVANSLCVKLAAAERADNRGNTRARDGSLGAFINEVNAQSGKKVPADKAPILIAFAESMMD